jgi:hypothetical protein
MPLCLACRREFAHHLVLEARALARWRGKSFDADAAVGQIGLTMMDAMGLTPRKRGDFETFQRHVVVTPVREDLPENPEEKFDPAAGERYEFHVGIVHPTPPEQLETLRQAALAGLAQARDYRDARLVGA